MICSPVLRRFSIYLVRTSFYTMADLSLALGNPSESDAVRLTRLTTLLDLLRTNPRLLDPDLPDFWSAGVPESLAHVFNDLDELVQHEHKEAVEELLAGLVVVSARQTLDLDNLPCLNLSYSLEKDTRPCTSRGSRGAFCRRHASINAVSRRAAADSEAWPEFTTWAPHPICMICVETFSAGSDISMCALCDRAVHLTCLFDAMQDEDLSVDATSLLCQSCFGLRRLEYIGKLLLIRKFHTNELSSDQRAHALSETRQDYNNLVCFKLNPKICPPKLLPLLTRLPDSIDTLPVVAATPGRYHLGLPTPKTGRLVRTVVPSAGGKDLSGTFESVSNTAEKDSATKRLAETAVESKTEKPAETQRAAELKTVTLYNDNKEGTLENNPLFEPKERTGEYNRQAFVNAMKYASDGGKSSGANAGAKKVSFAGPSQMTIGKTSGFANVAGESSSEMAKMREALEGLVSEVKDLKLQQQQQGGVSINKGRLWPVEPEVTRDGKKPGDDVFGVHISHPLHYANPRMPGFISYLGNKTYEEHASYPSRTIDLINSPTVFSPRGSTDYIKGTASEVEDLIPVEFRLEEYWGSLIQYWVKLLKERPGVYAIGESQSEFHMQNGRFVIANVMLCRTISVAGRQHNPPLTFEEIWRYLRVVNQEELVGKSFDKYNPDHVLRLDWITADFLDNHASSFLMMTPTTEMLTWVLRNHFSDRYFRLADIDLNTKDQLGGFKATNPGKESAGGSRLKRPKNSCVICWKPPSECPGYKAPDYLCKNRMNPGAIHNVCGYSHPWTGPRATECGKPEPWPRSLDKVSKAAKGEGSA